MLELTTEKVDGHLLRVVLDATTASSTRVGDFWIEHGGTFTDLPGDLGRGFSYNRLPINNIDGSASLSLRGSNFTGVIRRMIVGADNGFSA